MLRGQCLIPRLFSRRLLLQRPCLVRRILSRNFRWLACHFRLVSSSRAAILAGPSHCLLSGIRKGTQRFAGAYLLETVSQLLPGSRSLTSSGPSSPTTRGAFGLLVLIYCPLLTSIFLNAIPHQLRFALVP